MLLKSCGGLLMLVTGLSYATGGLGFGGYTREVGRPPAEVMEALADLDITAQPGSPGTDPSRSGGVQPVFLLERAPDRMIWSVMSGDQVAVRMIAIVEPVQGGKHSRVTAEVERGDAPDDFVSPAFRSTGITMGLFGMALEEELNELTAPPLADQAKCDALMAEFEAGNMAAGFGERPDNLQQAVGNTAKIAIRLHAMEAELRRNGCPTQHRRDFGEASDEMSKGSGGREGPFVDIPVEGVSFKPGQPMVDPTPRKGRN
jgi:hypothetical protein